MSGLDALGLDADGYLDMDQFPDDGTDVAGPDLAALREALLADPVDEPSAEEWDAILDGVATDAATTDSPFELDDPDGTTYSYTGIESDTADPAPDAGAPEAGDPSEGDTGDDGPEPLDGLDLGDDGTDLLDDGLDLLDVGGDGGLDPFDVTDDGLPELGPDVGDDC